MGRAYRGVVGAMLLLHPVPAECVVIKPGVLKQSDPLLPARRHVRAVVLIEVFSKESWKGAEARERAADLALANSGSLTNLSVHSQRPIHSLSSSARGEPRAPSLRHSHVQGETYSRIRGKHRGILKYGHRHTKIIYSR